MVDIMKYNELKLTEWKEKIKDCNGAYRLFCIDVDDVLFDIIPVMQKVLASIDYRATNKYREEISKETSEDAKAEFKKSYLILDAILEEHKCIIENDEGKKEKLDFSKPLIDYEKFYVDENLFPLAIEFIKFMILNKSKNDFFIFVSHRNPVREAIIKTRRLYELVPEIDGIITPPFHEEIGAEQMSNKGLFVMQLLELDNLDNCILIDNSKSNGIRWRKLGGYDIRFLPEGFQSYHTLTDHMSKITNLDPYMIQFCISYIKYARIHPEYPDEIHEFEKVKKLSK